MSGPWHIGFLALLWGQLFLALIPSWQADTYYSYGWLVPPAMAFFAYRRHGELPPRIGGPSRLSFAGLALLLAGLAFVLVLRILEGGNLHWRLPLWIHGATVVALSAFSLQLAAGGQALRHYAPVFVFALVAIPLPSALEFSLVAGLTEAVTATGGDLARVFGLPVEIAEAAFLVAGQPLDVNDGCSGIRSFQSSLMAGLFVGELLRLSLPSRVTLLLVSVAAAFVSNAGRVVVLIRAFAEGGREGMDAAHDGVGFAALAVSYGLITAAGFALDRWGPASDPSPPGSSPAREARWDLAPQPPSTLARSLFPVAIVLLLAIEGFRLWWFAPAGSGEAWASAPRATLDAAAMEAATPLQALPLRENVETGSLRFDRASFHRSPVEASAGPLRSLLFMEYRPGNPSIWHDLFTHPPEVCMRSTGCSLDETLPSRFIELGGRKIPVRCLKFREPVTGAPLYIFKMVWLPEESPIQPDTEKPEKRPLWIRMALARLPSPPGAAFLARIQRVDDFEQAWALVESEMLAYLELAVRR